MTTTTAKKVFYSKEPFIGFNEVSQDPHMRHIKPRGLWYSCGDSWKEWVLDEMPHWFETYKHSYEIKINPATMIMIQTPAEFEAFEAEYSIQSSFIDRIDWLKVASKYAGIEICPYMHKFEMTNWYYPWDIASGCVWHAEAILSVKEVPFDNYLQEDATKLSRRKLRKLIQDHIE